MTDEHPAAAPPRRLWCPWALRQVGVNVGAVLLTLVVPPLLSLRLRPDQPREALVALVVGTALLLWQVRRAARAVLVITVDELRAAGGRLRLDELIEIAWQTEQVRVGAGPGGGRTIHRLHARTEGTTIQLCPHAAGDDDAARFSDRLRALGLPVTGPAGRGGR